jgi:hypothetical protein
MNNITIIYYTANMETPEFEEKIRANIKKQAGDIPIISVSRKPISLGENICIGEKPVCYSNSFRQILIGLRKAKTKFCIAAESDTLYPPEYFQFTPPIDDQVFRYTNLFVYFDGYNRFWRKRYVEAAQMCGRDYWIESIEKVIGKKTTWEPVKNNPPFIFTTKDKYSWKSDNPVLTFKTRRGIGFKTGFLPGSVSTLPYWGSNNDVYNNYLK